MGHTGPPPSRLQLHGHRAALHQTMTTQSTPACLESSHPVTPSLQLRACRAAAPAACVPGGRAMSSPAASNITSVLKETRRFAPPADFAARAHIKSLADYE